MPAKLANGSILLKFSNCFSSSIFGNTGFTLSKSLNWENLLDNRVSFATWWRNMKLAMKYVLMIVIVCCFIIQAKIEKIFMTNWNLKLLNLGAAKAMIPIRNLITDSILPVLLQFSTSSYYAKNFYNNITIMFLTLLLLQNL